MSADRVMYFVSVHRDSVFTQNLLFTAVNCFLPSFPQSTECLHESVTLKFAVHNIKSNFE